MRGLEQHSAAVRGVGGFFQDAAADQLVRLDGDERAGAVQPRRHLADRHAFGTADQHEDLVLRARDAGDRGERVAAGVELVAVGDQIMDQIAELGVRAAGEQRGARDCQGDLRFPRPRHAALSARPITLVN